MLTTDIRKMKSRKIYCKFCSLNVPEYEVRYEVQNILDKLLPEPVLGNIIVCSVCSEKAKVFFNFKITCLHIEDEINSLISKELSQIDLKDVYFKVKTNRTLFSEKEKICRFCLSVAIDSYKELYSNDEEIIFMREKLQKYIPEVNLNNTKKPVSCAYCFEFLTTFFNFIKSYFDNEGSMQDDDIEIGVEEDELESGVNTKSDCEIQNWNAETEAKRNFNKKMERLILKLDMDEVPSSYRRAGNKCEYINCINNKRRNPELKFFRFPVRNEERLKQWILNSGNVYRNDVSLDYWKNRYLCSNHFEPAPYATDSKVKLKKTAVPFKHDGTSNVSVKQDIDVESQASNSDVVKHLNKEFEVLEQQSANIEEYFRELYKKCKQQETKIKVLTRRASFFKKRSQTLNQKLSNLKRLLGLKIERRKRYRNKLKQRKNIK